ncbi:Uncharacterised protein [Vibrio cholerae]|nr:Uncharacterised protein [Vibrio cholerae]CSI76265.1 Uncharacterised protein [Vibrio cholerae]
MNGGYRFFGGRDFRRKVKSSQILSHLIDAGFTGDPFAIHSEGCQIGWMFRHR